MADPLAPKLERCTVHGLHYDPAQTWGCAICREKRRVLLEERREQRRPLIRFATVMVLALAGAAWWWLR